MSYTFKNVYTKPNAETNIDFWTSDILTLIDTYFDAGKITQKPVKVVDGLTETYTTIFKDRASYDEFTAESACTSNLNKLETYCDENGISWNLVEYE